MASIVTPDGIIHPLTLTRTSLSNGDIDLYPNVVTYVARVEDVQLDSSLKASASDTGSIHQNDTNSTGGGFQSGNVTVTIPATLHIIKQVVNDNGGIAIPSDFNLHVKLAGVDVAGSPAVGIGSPGTLYSLDAGTYTVSEDVNSLYTQSFSGDCDAGGVVILSASDDKTCTIINDDILPTPPSPPPTPPSGGGGGSWTPPVPPFIDVVPVVNTVFVTSIPALPDTGAGDVPNFPKTGLSSFPGSALWNMIILFGEIIVFFISLWVVLKKRTN